MTLLDFALKIRSRPVLGYALSIALFIAGFLFHWGASDRGFPFVTFIPCVTLATLFGGRWPGILSAVLSGIAAWYFFLPPLQSFGLIWPTTYIALGLYTASVVIIISVIEIMYRAVAEYQAEKARTATMFHELQHRIANNLQFIGSMLSIQKRKIMKDPALAEALLDEASQRLNTMARIHRRLYDPANAGVEFHKLIEEISHDLIRAVGASNIVCIVDMPSIGWEPDRLVTLALMITEIITNSLKHAFSDTGGTIRISLTRTAMDKMELVIADDGKGLPPDFSLTSGKSLGMQIIQGLVNQIGGTLEITGAGGTVTKIVMPV